MIERHHIQAMGAALSRRDWHATEVAYNALRDEFDTDAREAAKWKQMHKTAMVDIDTLERNLTYQPELRDEAEAEIARLTAERDRARTNWRSQSDAYARANAAEAEIARLRNLIEQMSTGIVRALKPDTGETP